MIPPAGRRNKHHQNRHDGSYNEAVQFCGRSSLQVLLHFLVQGVLQVRHQHLLVQVLQGLPGRPHLRRPQLRVWPGQTDRRWSADVRWQNQHCSYDWSSAEDWTLAPNVWSDSSCRLYLWSQRLKNKWSCDTQTSRRHKHNSHTDSAFIKQLLQTLHVLSTFLSSCVSHLCCKLTTETLSEVVEVKPEQKSPDVELILTDSPLIMMMTVFWVQSCTWDTRTRINTTHTRTLLSLDWQLQPHLHRSSHLYSPLTTHT